jgi:hypothetical protein
VRFASKLKQCGSVDLYFESKDPGIHAMGFISDKNRQKNNL